MELYWKDTRIEPGMRLRVVEHGNDVIRSDGRRAKVTWDILDIRSREEGEHYYEVSTGKRYTLKKVMRSGKLRKKSQSGDLINIPASSDYLVVRESHDGEQAEYRCFSVDMLGLLRYVEILTDP